MQFLPTGQSLGRASAPVDRESPRPLATGKGVVRSGADLCGKAVAKHGDGGPGRLPASADQGGAFVLPQRQEGRGEEQQGSGGGHEGEGVVDRGEVHAEGLRVDLGVVVKRV